MARWWPRGIKRTQKRKLKRLRAKESQEKEAEKTFNDTHPLYPPPQKKWRPKAVEKKQTATEIESQPAPGADRPPFTRRSPTTRQHQWKRTTCWEKTWSTMRLLQNAQVWM